MRDDCGEDGGSFEARGEGLSDEGNSVFKIYQSGCRLKSMAELISAAAGDRNWAYHGRHSSRQLGFRGEGLKHVFDCADDRPAPSIGGVPGEPIEFGGEMALTLEDIEDRLLETFKEACERRRISLKVIT